MQIAKGRETILLVEDGHMALDIGAKALKSLGYTVLQARSCREAIEVYQEKRDKIHLVIFDMAMADMDGEECYDRMKAVNPRQKVLLSGCYSSDTQAREMLTRRCNSFIEKPFTREALSKAIRDVLDEQQV